MVIEQGCWLSPIKFQGSVWVFTDISVGKQNRWDDVALSFEATVFEVERQFTREFIINYEHTWFEARGYAYNDCPRVVIHAWNFLARHLACHRNQVDLSNCERVREFFIQ